MLLLLFVFGSTSVNHDEIIGFNHENIIGVNSGLLLIFSQVILWNYQVCLFSSTLVIYLRHAIICINLVSILFLSALLLPSSLSETLFQNRTEKTKLLPCFTFREHILHNLVSGSMVRAYFYCLQLIYFTKLCVQFNSINNVTILCCSFIQLVSI